MYTTIHMKIFSIFSGTFKTAKFILGLHTKSEFLVELFQRINSIFVLQNEKSIHEMPYNAETRLNHEEVYLFIRVRIKIITILKYYLQTILAEIQHFIKFFYRQ